MPHTPQQTSPEDQQNVSYLVQQYIRYRDDLAPRVHEWRRFYKVAKAFKEIGTYGYKYNVNKPIALMFIENFTSAIVNSVFSQRNLIEITPAEQFKTVRREVDDEKVAEQLTRVINRMLKNPDVKFKQSVRDIVKSLAYYGSVITQTLPRFGRWEDGVPYIGPDLRIEQVYNVLPNPYFKMLEEPADLFIREVITPAEMKLRERTMGYNNVDQAIAAAGQNYADEDVLHELKQIAGTGRTYRQGSPSNTGGNDGPDQRIFLSHYYDPWGGMRTLANQAILIYNSARMAETQSPDGLVYKLPTKLFNYYPFDSMRMNEGPAEFYGMGIPQLVEMTQSLMNLRSAQRSENIELVLQQCFLAQRDAGLNIEEMNMVPGGLIMTNNVDALKPVPVQDVTRSSYVEDETELKLAEEVVSVQQISRGSTPQRRVTATTSTQLLNQANQRSNTVLLDIGDLLVSVVRKVIVQIVTFMPREAYERLLGEPDAGLYQLNPAEINTLLDFTPEFGVGDSLKAQRLNSLTSFYQIAQQDPDVNRQQVIKDIGREMFPTRDPARYILTPQEKIRQALEQQQVQMALYIQGLQMQQQMLGGAVPPTQPDTPTPGNSDYKSLNPEVTEANVAAGGNA